MVGTTGWLEQLPEIKELCREKGKTVFYASNYSIGVNIFFEVNRRLAELMNGRNDYSAIVEEIRNYTEKLDAPSESAITIANRQCKPVGKKEKMGEPGYRYC